MWIQNPFASADATQCTGLNCVTLPLTEKNNFSHQGTELVPIKAIEVSKICQKVSHE